MSEAERLEPGGRLLARNTVLNLLGQALPLLVAAAAIPAAVHALGPQRFGVLGLTWMAISYFGEFGFGRATTKFVAAALGRGDTAGVVSATWGSIAVQLAVGVLLGAAVIAASPPLVDRVLHLPGPIRVEAVRSFLVLGACLPVLMLASAFRGVLEAAQRFGAVNAVRVPVSAGNYLAPLLGVLLGLGVPGIVALTMVVRAGSSAAYLLLALRSFPALRRPRVRRAELPELIRFGNWTIVSTAVAPLLLYMDRGLLAAIAGVAAVGYYTPAFELVLRLLIFPVAVTGTLFPAVSTLAERAESARVGELLARSTKYVLLVIAPASLLLAAGAHDLLRLWLGAEFARQVGLAMQILALGIFLNAPAYIALAPIHGAGRADIPGKLYLLELPLCALLAWVLIREFGIPGAALAWAIRSAFDSIVLSIIAGRLFPEAGPALRAAHVPALLAGVFAAGVGLVAAVGTVPTLWGRGVLTLAALTGGSALLWRSSFSADERARILALLPLGRGR